MLLFVVFFSHRHTTTLEHAHHDTHASSSCASSSISVHRVQVHDSPYSYRTWVIYYTYIAACNESDVHPCIFIFIYMYIHIYKCRVALRRWKDILPMRDGAAVALMPCEFCASSDLEKYFEYQGQDYICSKPDDSGMHSCSNLPPLKIGKFHKYSICSPFIIHVLIYFDVNLLLNFLCSRSLFHLLLFHYLSFVYYFSNIFFNDDRLMFTITSYVQYSSRIFINIIA